MTTQNQITDIIILDIHISSDSIVISSINLRLKIQMCSQCKKKNHKVEVSHSNLYRKVF